jgi:membrane glycosyltransferase
MATEKPTQEKVVSAENHRNVYGPLMEAIMTPFIHITYTILIWIGLCVMDWVFGHPTGLIGYGYFALAALAYLPFSFLLITFIYSFAYKGESLPRRFDLMEKPRVAVLYTTYNDILPITLERTEEAIDYPADLWVLSDSDDPDAIEKEQSFGWWTWYTREDGRGGKCGMINDWLDEHGDEYDYFITMDADSIFDDGNITRLVEHAEHPSNQDIGVFQMLMEVHPALATTTFSRVIGRGVQWSTRFLPMVMKSVYGQNTYWGSNGLVRVEAVRDIGGYNEELLCEDFVLTTELDKAGWRAVIVDEYSYEGFPLDLHTLRTRTVRWVRANREMFSMLFTKNVSIGTRLNCITPLVFYMITPILLALVVLPLLVSNIGVGGGGSMWYAAAVFGFIFLHRMVAARDQPLKFIVTAILETLAILGMSLRVTYALLIPDDTWDPCSKEEQSFTWRESFRFMVPELLFGLVLLGSTIYTQSLAGDLLTGVWGVAFVSGPIILRYTSD